MSIIWLALGGETVHLTLGVVGLGLLLTVPYFVVGPPDYPEAQLRQAVLSTWR